MIAEVEGAADLRMVVETYLGSGGVPHSLRGQEQEDPASSERHDQSFLAPLPRAFAALTQVLSPSPQAVSNTCTASLMHDRYSPFFSN